MHRQRSWLKKVNQNNYERKKKKKNPENIRQELSNIFFFCLLRYSYYEHLLIFSEIFTTTLSCDMNFESFPYDYHECIINFKNWYGSAWRVQLQSPKIYMLDKNGLEIGGSEFNYTKSGRLNYNFNLKSLPKSVYLENEGIYIMTFTDREKSVD